MKEEICIGLFGTCDNSKWRDEFIEYYEASNINYFNPDAGDDWHPGMIEDENRHLREDQIVLFPVLGESLGLGSLGEIGFSVMNVIRNIEGGTNQYLIVMIDDECTAESASESEKKHSNRARKLVKSKLLEVTHPNIMVVDSLNSMLLASSGLIDVINLQSEIKNNFNVENIA
jgi:hypothetical protein